MTPRAPESARGEESVHADPDHHPDGTAKVANAWASFPLGRSGRLGSRRGSLIRRCGLERTVTVGKELR